MTYSDTQSQAGQPRIQGREPVYTDMSPGVTLQDSEGVSLSLPRFGVWTRDMAKRRHQVAEVGENLAALRAKYGEGPWWTYCAKQRPID